MGRARIRLAVQRHCGNGQTPSSGPWMATIMTKATSVITTCLTSPARSPFGGRAQVPSRRFEPIIATTAQASRPPNSRTGSKARRWQREKISKVF